MIVLSSMLTVLYVGRFFECVWFREPSPEAATATEPPFEMLVPICLLAAATVYFGIDTELTAGMAQRAATALLEGLR